MSSVSLLLDLVHARSSDAEPRPDLGRAQRLFLAALGMLCAIGFASLWGLAASPTTAHAAIVNAVKVPMLLIVSGAVSLPAVVLFCKLASGAAARTSDLLLGYSVAVFGGTLVLAALSPLVALYQHSSAFAGPMVALASAVIAVAVGGAIFVRALGRLVAPGTRRRTMAVPVTLMVVVQLAALAQLASVVSPVFGARTRFGRGVDALDDHAATSAPSLPEAEATR